MALEVAMTKKTAHETVRPILKFPHEDSAIAVYLTKQIEALSGVKSQREIAYEVGYEKPNIISMLKRGETKVPLDKVPALAKALHVDPAHLFRLALEQHSPQLAKIYQQIVGYTVTENEFELIDKIRQLTKNTDPKFSAAQLRQIKEILV